MEFITAKQNGKLEYKNNRNNSKLKRKVGGNLSMS